MENKTVKELWNLALDTMPLWERVFYKTSFFVRPRKKNAWYKATGVKLKTSSEFQGLITNADIAFGSETFDENTVIEFDPANLERILQLLVEYAPQILQIVLMFLEAFAVMFLALILSVGKGSNAVAQAPNIAPPVITESVVQIRVKTQSPLSAELAKYRTNTVYARIGGDKQFAIDHLLTHSYTIDQLEGLSYQELKDLHNLAHGPYINKLIGGRAVISELNCVNGQCFRSTTTSRQWKMPIRNRVRNFFYR